MLKDREKSNLDKSQGSNFIKLREEKITVKKESLSKKEQTKVKYEKPIDGLPDQSKNSSISVKEIK